MLSLACWGGLGWLAARGRVWLAPSRPSAQTTVAVAQRPAPASARASACAAPSPLSRTLPAQAVLHAAWVRGLVAAGLLLAVLGLALALAVDQARTQARWLAATLAPSVLFDNARDAQQLLDALRQWPEVQAAWVHGHAGQVLARHVPGQPAAAGANGPAGDSRPAGAAGLTAPAAVCAQASGPGALLRLRPAWLMVAEPVHALGAPVGHLCLQISLRPWQRGATLALLLAGVLAALAWQTGRAGGRR